LKLHLGFACKISSGAPKDNIFAALKTSVRLFSKAGNYMHSQASFHDKILRLKRARFFYPIMKYSAPLASTGEPLWLLSLYRDQHQGKFQ
jgi:hypothetical protein